MKTKCEESRSRSTAQATSNRNVETILSTIDVNTAMSPDSSQSTGSG